MQRKNSFLKVLLILGIYAVICIIGYFLGVIDYVLMLGLAVFLIYICFDLIKTGLKKFRAFRRFMNRPR